MFLSKDENGIYYLYYAGTNGKRNKVSTKSKLKSNALRFVSRFSEQERLKAEKQLEPMTLADYRSEIVNHS